MAALPPLRLWIKNKFYRDVTNITTDRVIITLKEIEYRTHNYSTCTIGSFAIKKKRIQNDSSVKAGGYMKLQGHFFYSDLQAKAYRFTGHNHLMYCIINNKRFLYTQLDQRPMYFKILFWLGFIRPNNWNDTKYLGYGEFSHLENYVARQF